MLNIIKSKKPSQSKVLSAKVIKSENVLEQVTGARGGGLRPTPVKK